MWELLHKIKQLSEGSALDLHRGMVRVEYDAVLVVVNVRRILEEPVTLVDGYRNDAVVLSRRMVDASCVSLVFLAQEAFRIAALLCQLRRRNRLRVLLRLRQIDRDIQRSELCVRRPFQILLHAVSADIVRVSGQFVKIIRRRLRRLLLIKIIETADHLAWSWNQHAHDLCVKQIAVCNRIVRDQHLLRRIVEHLRKDLRQCLFGALLRHRRALLISRRGFILQFVNVKQLQQTVDRKPLILRLYESRHQSVFCQFQYSFLYHDPTSFLNILCHYANFTGPSPISTT